MNKDYIMKHNIIFGLLAFFLLIACSSDDDKPTVPFALDTEQATVEGSFVQGAQLQENCKALFPYVNARGGSAKLYSDEVNGLSVPETEVSLDQGEGIIKVQVKGRPIELGLTHLPVYVKYMGMDYVTTVSAVVFEDSDPNGTIEFTISTEPLINMTGEEVIEFTVVPTMTAVTVEDIAGLTTKITQDMVTGKGTLTLTPLADLLSESVQVTASFGARPSVLKTIEVNAFASGTGVVDSPYEITNEVQLMKVNIGYDRFFKLTEDLMLNGNWTPLCLENAFIGGFDGENHTISYSINSPESDNLGFFANIGSGAGISNLKVSGKITGKNKVAGFAAFSDAALVNCSSDVEVKGENNLAVLIASGAGQDADVLVVGTSFPKLLNIPAGDVFVEEFLDITPTGVTVTVLDNETGAVIAYNDVTGKISADISGGSFTKGDVTVEIKLGTFVTLLPKTIGVDSKKMFESGDGTQASPYLVIDADQFTITLSTYPDSYIKLGGDITLANAWEPIQTFTGDLDGSGYKVNGLVINNTTKDRGFVGTNEGKIHDLKFVDVNVTTSAAMGVIAGINKGTIENVEVTGTITSTHSGDVLGGIAGENINQAFINNCYVNVNMTASAGMVGGIVGRNKGTGAGVSVTNCTSEGSILITASKTRVAGIVGRGEGPDLIKGCLSTMTIGTTSKDSNGFGGIFGANNNNNMKIEECMFAGSIKSGNDVGGIAGVAANVMNCLVENATISNNNAGSNGNAAGLCGTNKIYAKYSIVRGTVIDGVSETKKAISGVNGNYQNNGTTISCVVQGVEIKGAKVQRIAATTATGMANNWACGVILKSGAGDDISNTAVDNAAGLDGGTIAEADLTQAFYEGLGYDFTNIWIMKDGKPSLRNVDYKQQ